MSNKKNYSPIYTIEGKKRNYKDNRIYENWNFKMKMQGLRFLKKAKIGFYIACSAF